jgi:hypothetical protein
VALREGPFERFLFLDSDTILMGDLRERLFRGKAGDDWDVFIDRPMYDHGEKGVKNWFFNTELLPVHYPSFDWRAYTRRYYCTGVWAAKRGVFPLEEYKAILLLRQAEPGLFYPGEMGFLNFMIFQAEAEGRMKVADDEIQVIVPDFTLDELKARWHIEQPPANVPPAQAAVLHYTSVKPTLSRGAIAAPMTFFRRQAAKAMGLGPTQSTVRLLREDMYYDLRQLKMDTTVAVRRLVKGSAKAS